MQFIKHSFIIGLIAILVSSCLSFSEPQRLDSFVDKVELNSSSYSSEDWEESAIQYQKLVDDYMNSGKQYSDAEKEMAVKAMGRYHALLIKSGIEKSASFLKEFGKVFPSYLDGIVEGIDANSEDIEKSLNNLFDEEKIEKSLESLNDKLEQLFGNPD